MDFPAVFDSWKVIDFNLANLVRNSWSFTTVLGRMPAVET